MTVRRVAAREAMERSKTTLGGRLGPWVLLLAAALAASGQTVRPIRGAPSAPAVTRGRVTSAGVFSDAAGGKHSWQITRAHTLIWDSSPYLPVGGTFAARSLLTEDESAWQQDARALALLKEKGVRDLILWPGRPLTEITPTAIQRLIDLLDAGDFRYGLAFGPGMTTPLKGTVVKPGAYRIADAREGNAAVWRLSDSDSGVYVLADTTNKTNTIARSATVTVREDTVSVPVSFPPGITKAVALLFPHKTLTPHREGVVPDLWDAFDTYRDRTLHVLRQVRFGKGFRFFLDPLARHLGLSGECNYLVPDSAGFVLEWESYLARRYASVEEIRHAWALTEAEFKSHREAARLIPFWADDHGVPYLHDPQTGRDYRVTDVRDARWWSDFAGFRNESIQYYMHSLADLLKREVAEVPVVYTWTQPHPLFRTTNQVGGFDGLAVASPARSAGSVARILGPAYSAAEQSERTVWMIASEFGADAGAAPESSGPTSAAHTAGQTAAAPLYASRPALFADLDRLRQTGCKGIFVRGFSANPDEKAADWLNPAENLTWLRDYAARLDGEPALAAYMPRVLFFPQSAPGPAHVGPIPGAPNVLWLDSFEAGQEQNWWPSYNGYTLRPDDPLTSETVMVSLMGRRETHFMVPNARGVQVFTPEGSPVPMKLLAKNRFSVWLDSTPVVFRTGAQKLMPEEAAQDAVIQLAGVFRLATDERIPSVDAYRASLDRAQFALKQKDFETAYTFALGALNELTALAAPYIWLEGETPLVHTFTETARNPEASHGWFLRLASASAPGRLGYSARYDFRVSSDGRYNIWLAGTPPGPSASPIRWHVNTEPEQEVADPAPRGPLYLSDRFGWFLLGSANLQKGQPQALVITVADRAAESGMYVFSIDSIMITRGKFTPNGAVRPLPVDPSTVTLPPPGRMLSSPALEEYEKPQKRRKR